MAGTEKEIRAYIKAEQRKGTPNGKIIVGMTKLGGQAGKDVQKMIKTLRDANLSPTQELGAYFGLNSGPVDPKAKTPVNKNASIGQKAKSYATSAAMGLADAGAGIVQGAAYAGDKVNEGINSALGTNLSTSAYKDYNKQYQDANANADLIRAEGGRSGGDFVRGGTEMAATVPAFFVGGGAGQGVKQGAKFAGRQGAIGTGVGAARYAENSDQRTGNMILGGVGGSVGGVIGEKIAAPVIGKGASMLARRSANKSGQTTAAAVKLVDDAIRETGITVKPAIRTQLVKQATDNLSKSKQIDAAAAVRKSLLDSEGIKGTRAQISRNPSEWRAERELAKQGNNPLNNVHINNNEQLASKWQSLADETGASPTDANTRMASTFQTLKQGDDAAKVNVSSLYDNARSSAGNDVPLNHIRFIDQTSQQLEQQGLGSFLKGDIRGIFKGMFDDPNYQLTLGKSEEINKVLNARLKTTTDGNERYALGLVKDNLAKEVDETMNGLGSVDGRQATESWTGAKSAHASRMQNIESNPTLKAAIDDVAPDDAFNKYVLKADERDLIRLVDDLKSTPQGQQNLADLQGETIEHFLSKATQADNGAFSPAMLNKAIKSFGNNRMRALFTPQQIARINDVQKVSDILMQQPLGANVNHSNTSSALINALVGVAGGLGKMPMGLGHVANVATGGVAGVVGMSKKGAAATATSRAMNGQPAITKGSNLGLTDEQLRMLGMIPQASGIGGAVGAGLSN